MNSIKALIALTLLALFMVSFSKRRAEIKKQAK